MIRSLLFAALLAVPFATYASDPSALELPQIGEPADLSLSPAKEQELGANVVAQLYAHGFILEDAELTEYINNMGWRLASHTTGRPAQLTFFVVRDSRINAFALPGGYIGMNAGLIMAAQRESEAAGVMAHELAHVNQRHIARTIEGMRVSTIATWAAVLAAIIAGSAHPDVILAALSLGQAATYQQQVNFTRAHELEADRLGIRTLADAGYDPDGMAAFFQRLEQQSRLYGAGLPEILRTHPVTTTRIAEARARAADYGPRDVRDSVEFGLMQARARVLTASRPSEPLEAFSRRVAAGDDSPGLRYGAALALLELGQYGRALQLLEPALEAMPRQPNLRLLQARIQLAARDIDAALATLQKTLEHHPRYAPGILAYADALITVGRPAEARQFLLDKEDAVDQHPEAYRLLSLAAREMNNNGERAYQMALFLYRRGNAGGALEQLDAGLRLAELSEQERARMSAFRAEVRDKLPRNYRSPEERR